MKRASALLLTLVLLLSSMFASLPASAEALLKDRKDFEWGIGGHNSAYPAYPERTHKEQVRLAAQMGCDIYRLNYNPTNLSMLNYLDKMVAEIQAYGMDVMLVMDDTSGTPQDVANRAKIVAGRYKKGSQYGFIKYIQVFGEVDVVALEQSGTTYKYEGDKPEHYDPKVIDDWYEKFNAALTTIRSVNPDVKTVVSFSYLHVILYPFLFKILASFMSLDDMYDPTVMLIPKNWTLDIYRELLQNPELVDGFWRTAVFSVVVAVLATASSALVGYGLARFRFPGCKLLVGVVVFTMMLPIQTVSLPLYSSFRFFDFFGVVQATTGSAIQLTNTIWPMTILAATTLSFRAGIFVILTYQYYRSIPDELIEAAHVDGSGTFRTFFRIVVPMAKSIFVVVFSLSFAWQWTDTFYSNLLMGEVNLLPNVIAIMNTVSIGNKEMYYTMVKANAATILALLPLLLFYCLLQRKIIQGIERSGLVG